MCMCECVLHVFGVFAEAGQMRCVYACMYVCIFGVFAVAGQRCMYVCMHVCMYFWSFFCCKEEVLDVSGG